MLLSFSPTSIYCAAADIHIDPWQPVDYAVITHAHSDHARAGCKHYLAHEDSESILRLRLGDNISIQTVAYGEKIFINGVQFSLHPAGHIIGSAQIRVEHNDEVWVASGDYKTLDDGFCKPFEPVRCDTFITESTFGLPVYKWPSQQQVMNEIKSWWQENQLQGKASVLMGYALGKMQRLIKNLQPFEHRVFAHGAIFNINERLRAAGFDLPFIPLVTNDIDKKLYRGALILATPSSLNTPWLNRFNPYSTGYCSGWMAVRGAKNSRAVDRGFVLSDHADWNELNNVVAATNAKKVFVTHGYTDTYSKWLNEQGIEAAEVKTNYGEEELTQETTGA
ncbi:ligase-associated DNA damage response exonuclease [soil metagenome]